MDKDKITWNYGVIIFLGVFFTWLIHEFAHWTTGELLGYKMIMTLNSTSPAGGKYDKDFHVFIISSTGPIVTIIQALLIFIFLNGKGWYKYLYPFLLTPFYMRLLAGLMNFINLNDEGRIGEYFGIGVFTLPLMVSGFLFYMVYQISGKYDLGWKFQAITIIMVMVFSSALILTDQFLKVRIF